MIKFNYPIFSLLLVTQFFTSCNGQTSTKQKQNDTYSSKTIEQQAKIIRTQGTQSGVVGCELLDKDGNIWFSISGEGAYRYDGKTFTNFTTKDGLCNNNVGAIIQDKEGNILFGTNSGICIYDGNKFTKYPATDTLSITCMLEDKDGNLWFGTSGKGIYRYNGKTLRYGSMTEKILRILCLQPITIKQTKTKGELAIQKRHGITFPIILSHHHKIIFPMI